LEGGEGAKEERIQEREETENLEKRKGEDREGT